MTNYDLILDNEGNKMILRPHAFGLKPAVSSDYISGEQSYNERVAASELKKAAGAERISIYDIYEMEDQLTNEGNF